MLSLKTNGIPEPKVCAHVESNVVIADIECIVSEQSNDQHFFLIIFIIIQ